MRHLTHNRHKPHWQYRTCHRVMESARYP